LGHQQSIQLKMPSFLMQPFIAGGMNTFVGSIRMYNPVPLVYLIGRASLHTALLISLRRQQTGSMGRLCIGIPIFQPHNNPLLIYFGIILPLESTAI
jgi:hypothetical protein